MMYRAYYQSPLGELTLLYEDTRLIGLWFENQNHFAKGYELEMIEKRESVLTCQVCSWLDDYFLGKQPDPRQIEVLPQVSAYRMQVLKVLQHIPYGQVTTYQQLADQVAQNQAKPKGSARAVGGAVAHNPIAILIPCHRVIGVAGNLVGYAGGLERKKALLQIEGVYMNW